MTFTIREAQADAVAQSHAGRYLASRLGRAVKEATYHERERCLRLVGFRGQLTRIELDAKGNVARMVSPLGRQFLYDYEGTRPTSVKLPTGLDIHTRYDAAGRVLRSERSDGELTQLIYDSSDRVAGIGTADGAYVQLRFDAHARVEAVLERDGSESRFEHDENGRIVRAHDPLGRATSISYGAGGAPQHIVEPDGGLVEYTYDDGEVQETLNGVAHAVYTTDAAGRLAGAKHSDGYEWSLVYDEDGRLEAALSSDAEVRYDYDDSGRVIAEDQSGKVVRYLYNDDGQLAGLVLPDGRSVAYEYDFDGRLERARDWLGTEQRFVYGAAEHPVQRQLPNGLFERYSLDLAGRVSSIEVHRQEHVYWSQHYTRDSVGRISRLTDTRTGAQHVQYDAQGRLCSVRDASGRVIEAFAYDAASQRVASPEGSATFDAVCRPKTSGARSFDYDGLGNRIAVTEAGRATKLTWSGNRLRELELPDGVRVRYAYDALGRRTVKWVGATKVTYIWAGHQLVQEIHESREQSHTVEYLYWPGTFQPLAKCEGGRVYYYHCDQLGTPQHLTDATSKLVWSARYSAFGSASIDFDHVAQPLRFAGQYWDSESGLHYNRARYYDPTLGAYLSRDPLAAHASNSYLYAKASPLNAIDPLGLFWEDAPGWVKTTATIAAGVVVGVAIGAAVIALAPALGVAAGVAGVAAIIAGGIAGGAAAGGLDAAMTEDGCVWCGIGKGALIGGLAALPFAFLPASAGYLAFAGVGAASGAIGYFADLGLNGGDFSWGGLGTAVALGAGFGVAGKFISGRFGGKQSGGGKSAKSGKGGTGSQAGGTSAKDAAKARASTAASKEKMAGAAKNTTADGEPSVATNRDAEVQPRDQMTKLMRERIEAQEKVIETNKRLLEEGKTTEQINRMSDAEMRAELAKDGVPPDVQGMDTAEQLRATNTRIKMRENQNNGPMTDGDWKGLRKENGNHGEVKAVDDELRKIEKAKGREATPQDLADLELHNTQRPKGGQPVGDEAMPRCEHCQGLTKGVKTTPELESAENTMNGRNRELFHPRDPFGPSTPQGHDGSSNGGASSDDESGGAGNVGEGGGEGASGVDSLFD